MTELVLAAEATQWLSIVLTGLGAIGLGGGVTVLLTSYINRRQSRLQLRKLEREDSSETDKAAALLMQQAMEGAAATLKFRQTVIDDLQKQQGSLETRLESFSADLKSTKDRIEECESKLADMVKQRDQAMEERDDARERVDQLEQRVADLESAVPR